MGAATALLVTADADLAFAAVVLLLAVAGASVLGYATGLTAALASVLALTYYFTPPVHSFRIDQPDDILALVAFVAVSLLVGATIAHLNQLRTDAERLDAEARDERMRSELSRSRAALLTAITHDLRTPLASIKAASGALLASDSRLDLTERRELLEGTYAEADRLQRLVDKVLEMGRIRSGAIRPEPVAIAPLDLFHAATARRGRSLVFEPVVLQLDPDLPEVAVDVVLIEHVLVNLLENAVVHGSSGTPIEVRGTSDDGRVRIAVVDHGEGVPVGDRERIFGEFVRRDAPTDGTGTGLGLTIVRALVEAHDGSVWCEETPGGGATFVVDLPCDEGGHGA